MKRVLRLLLVCCCLAALLLPVGCADQKETSEAMIVANELRHDALKINNSIKTFYTNVKLGSVNEESDGDKVTEPLPGKDANMAERQEAAKSLTVRSALEKSGLTEYLKEDVISDFVFDAEKNIYYKDDIKPENIKGTLSLSTKLGDILD